MGPGLLMFIKTVLGYAEADSRFDQVFVAIRRAGVILLVAQKIIDTAVWVLTQLPTK